MEINRCQQLDTSLEICKILKCFHFLLHNAVESDLVLLVLTHWKVGTFHTSSMKLAGSSQNPWRRTFPVAIQHGGRLATCRRGAGHRGHRSGGGGRSGAVEFAIHVSGGWIGVMLIIT